MVVPTEPGLRRSSEGFNGMLKTEGVLALRLEAIALWLEAIALWLEAIALRWEAIAGGHRS